MKLEEKLSGKIGVRVGNEFTLFISNEDINNMIKILKSLENSNVLIDGITETVKHEIKKQEDEFIPAFLAPLAASLVQSVISSVVKGMSRTRIRRARRGHINKNVYLRSIL